MEKQIVTEDMVYTAIKGILADKASYNTSLNYAVNYCRSAFGLSGNDLKTQVLYILNNISRWRNPNAKEIRGILKSYAGVK